jgi:SAM-dependent methyltransferase
MIAVTILKIKIMMIPAVVGYLVLPAVKPTPTPPRIQLQRQKQQEPLSSGLHVPAFYQEEDVAAQRWIPTYTIGGCGDSPPVRYALDVCCGIGDSTRELIDRLPFVNEWKVLGLDEDYDQIVLAKKKHPYLQFLTGETEMFPSESFDWIQLYTGRLLFIKNKWKLVKELTRLLKPGGTLEVYDFCLSHSFIHEVMSLEEDDREHFFCGWRNYDPKYHHMLLSERLDILGVSMDEQQEKGVVRATFKKY